MSDSTFIQTALQHALFATKRVRYSAGQLLGVDEFRDEQRYFFGKHAAHQALLHGYGTVAGLAVHVEEQEGDLDILVDEGVGVDRLGRVFMIAPRQCTSLRQWLSARPSLDAMTVYVVARYAHTETDPVSLIGQSCSNDSEAVAASRLTDSFWLELSAEKPPMPAWDAVRAFSGLLARIEIAEATDPHAAELLHKALSSLAALLAVGGEDSAGRADGSPSLKVSLADWHEAMRAWVLRLLPQALQAEADSLSAQPDQPDPSAILLAQVTFERTARGNDLIIAPPADGALALDQRDRPLLLHTQLIQMLSRGGSGGAPAVDLDALLARVLSHVRTAPLVTITPLGVAGDNRDQLVFELWFHLDLGVLRPTASLTDDLKVMAHAQTAGGNFSDIEIALKPEPNLTNVFRLTMPVNRRRDLRFLRFAVPLEDNRVTLGGQDEVTTLHAFMLDNHLLFEGYSVALQQPAVVVYVRQAPTLLPVVGDIEREADA